VPPLNHNPSINARFLRVSSLWLPDIAKAGLLDQVYSYEEQDELFRKRDNKPPRDDGDPLPYQGSVTRPPHDRPLKPVTQNLLLWMMRHLDKLELADWIVENGGHPHQHFCWLYDNSRYQHLKPKLNRSQKAFWDILTSKFYNRIEVKSDERWRLHWHKIHFDDFLMRENFLSHIQPTIGVKKALRYKERGVAGDDFMRLFDFEVKSRAPMFDHHIATFVKQSEEGEEIHGLDTLCVPLSHIIAEYLRLEWVIRNCVERERNDFPVNYYEDYSFISLRSIAPHEQNEYPSEFDRLVFLLRESWRQTHDKNPQKAREIAQSWLTYQMSLFERLFLYAARETGEAFDDIAYHFLTENNFQKFDKAPWGLELHRYLTERIIHWPDDRKDEILRHMTADWDNIDNSTQYYLLKKLIYFADADALPDWANTIYQKLKKKYPTIKKEPMDGFAVYSGGVRDVHFGEALNARIYKEFKSLKPDEKIVYWNNLQDKDKNELLENLGQERPYNTIKLMDQALQHTMNVRFWQKCFLGLRRFLDEHKRKDYYASLMFQILGPLILKMPDNLLRHPKIANPIADLFRKLDQSYCEREQVITVWSHCLGPFSNLEEWQDEAHNSDDLYTMEEKDNDHDLPEDASEDRIFKILISPAAEITEKLFEMLWPNKAKVGSLLPEDMKHCIDQILKLTENDQKSPAGFILASYIGPFHAIDPDYYEKLLALLSYEKRPQSAKFYWAGYLRRPGITSALYKSFAKNMMLSAKYMFQNQEYNCEFNQNFYRLFLYVSMERRWMSPRRTKAMMKFFSEDQLKLLSNYIWHWIKNKQAQSNIYWDRTLRLWLTRFWPWDEQLRTRDICEDFILMALHTGHAFPIAYRWCDERGFIRELNGEREILYYLSRDSDEDASKNYLKPHNLVETYPEDILDLLYKTKPFYDEDHYKSKILDRLIQAKPELRDDPRYKDL
jgi:hypothetical protein